MTDLKELYIFLFNKMLECQIQPKMILEDINTSKTSFFIEIKQIIDEFTLKNNNIKDIKKDNMEKFIFSFLFRKSGYLTDGLFECKYYEGNDSSKKCTSCNKMKDCPYILYQLMVRNEVDKLITNYFGIYGYGQFLNTDLDELYGYYNEEINNKRKTDVIFMFKQ